MKEQAVEKLRAEMAEKQDDSYIQLVGGYMISDLDANPEHAHFILADGKTIAGSLKEMERIASGKCNGKNFAVLTPNEGFSAVMGYFGIVEAVNMAGINHSMVSSAAAPARPPAASTGFDISLDDLLQEAP